MRTVLSILSKFEVLLSESCVNLIKRSVMMQLTRASVLNVQSINGFRIMLLTARRHKDVGMYSVHYCYSMRLPSRVEWRKGGEGARCSWLCFLTILRQTNAHKQINHRRSSSWGHRVVHFKQQLMANCVVSSFKYCIEKRSAILSHAALINDRCLLLYTM